MGFMEVSASDVKVTFPNSFTFQSHPVSETSELVKLPSNSSQTSTSTAVSTLESKEGRLCDWVQGKVQSAVLCNETV